MRSIHRLTFVIVILIFNLNSADCQVAKRLDIVITELFPDPTPSFGLPTFEFIEIRNISSTPYNLKDWKLGDAVSSGTINTNIIIHPDSCIIICPNSATALFNAFGTTIGISNFPSLDNESDLVILRSSQGNVIHAVEYKSTWYQNDVKSNGGWSLEMIDPHNPCSGKNNWIASKHLAGGSPGRQNSSAASNIDDVAPTLVRSFAIDSNIIAIVFDEPVDSVNASIASKYSLGSSVDHPLRASPIGPLFKEVHLQFSNALIDEIIYDITVTGVTDCTGNEIFTNNLVKTGRFSKPDSPSIIINELLFNPKRDGFDFVELYNTSKKVIDLKHLYLSNRNPSGNLSNSVQLSESSYAFLPGEYLVFTENKNWLEQNYTLNDHRTVIELSSLPSMPDDIGSIVLTEVNGQTIEEVRYDSKWHFALLSDVEGISLERINYRISAHDQQNWTSAASTAGFATPGYQNSQFMSDLTMHAQISINPKVFSPDNDGRDDVATISYELLTAGFVCNIIIFDANGRRVKHLAKNATLAQKGNFRWDGLDDNSQTLPIGIYVVFTEIFNLKGKTKKFKNVVTLARELR